MKTAKQIKKEARERFEKEFVKKQDILEATEENPIIYGVEPSVDKVKKFLDQLIDDTINQTLEGVKTNKEAD